MTLDLETLSDVVRDVAELHWTTLGRLAALEFLIAKTVLDRSALEQDAEAYLRNYVEEMRRSISGVIAIPADDGAERKIARLQGEALEAFLAQLESHAAARQLARANH